MWSASRPCPHASWNKKPTTSALKDHRQHARGGRSCLELGDGPSCGLGGHLLDWVLVEHLVTEGVGEALGARLHAAVSRRHTSDEEAGTDAVVVREQPVGVRDQDAAPSVAVSGAHLHNGPASRACGLVGSQQQVDLCRL